MAFLVWQSVKYPIAEIEHGFNRMGLDEVHQILIVTIPVSGNQRLGGFIPLPTGAIQGLINIISKSFAKSRDLENEVFSRLGPLLVMTWRQNR